MTAFVLGNGVSRKGIDLYNLKKKGQVFGCNALYREFDPDVLVSTDPGISKEIQDSGWPKKNNCTHYTRRPFADSGSKSLHPDYKGMSSGPNALKLACLDKLEHQIIYLLGFDLGSPDGKLFNNVYAGTEFYKREGDSATFGGNWFNQITQIMKEHKLVQFYRVVTDDSRNFDKLGSIPNLKLMEKSEFQSLYK
jgi:hypothetical protein